MAKAKKLVLPKDWRTFVNRYGADRAYWYVPNGLAVTADALKPRLEIFMEFEHRKTWRDCQQAYIQRLNEKAISGAEAEWEKAARRLRGCFSKVSSCSDWHGLMPATGLKSRIRKSLTTDTVKVLGVIVAREIEDKLKAARDAHDTKVDLIEFEMKIGAKAV